MHNKPLKLGDLVKPERLKKPAEGMVKVELGAKPEKIKLLEDKMSGVAGSIEADMNVKASDLIGLTETVKKALVKELAPEKAQELLAVLKKRFLAQDKHYSANKEHIKAVAEIRWEKVQNRLEAHPEKLWSLNEMERTGGEPDVFGYDAKTGEYIFVDFSVESPTGRRNCCYDLAGQQESEKNGDKPNGNAVSMAAMMGATLLGESEYRKLQTKGEFDKNSWSWLKTPVDERREGVALDGDRAKGGVYVGRDYPNIHRDDGGFRASLRF